MNKTLITFASEGYEKSAEALMKSAQPYFDNFRIYTPEDIRDFMAEHPAHFENIKGMGFWAWKPYIITDALKRVSEGSTVMYTDACLEFERDPAGLFNDGDIKIFSCGQPHIRYCKRYTINKMGVAGDIGLNYIQANGAFQIYRNTPLARAFLFDYYKYCSDLKCINDELSEEMDGFIEHRHDQAILTNLCLLNGIPIEQDISQYGTSNPIINHHRRRL